MDDYKRKCRFWNACCCIEGCVNCNFILPVCDNFFSMHQVIPGVVYIMKVIDFVDSWM